MSRKCSGIGYGSSLFDTFFGVSQRLIVSFFIMQFDFMCFKVEYIIFHDVFFLSFFEYVALFISCF